MARYKYIDTSPRFLPVDLTREYDMDKLVGSLRKFVSVDV